MNNSDIVLANYPSFEDRAMLLINSIGFESFVFSCVVVMTHQNKMLVFRGIRNDLPKCSFSIEISYAFMS